MLGSLILKTWDDGFQNYIGYIPSGIQTWLAGKLTVYSWFSHSNLHSWGIFKDAMFDCRMPTYLIYHISRTTNKRWLPGLIWIYCQGLLLSKLMFLKKLWAHVHMYIYTHLSAYGNYIEHTSDICIINVQM